MSDEFSVLDIQLMTSNFETHTVKKLKNARLMLPETLKTDGVITKTVSFKAADLRRHLEIYGDQDVTFQFASFTVETAQKYVKKLNMSENDISKIVEKPTMILKTKDEPSINARTINIVGAICPPPTSCP
jgi:predicted alpha/beta-fold hydrolase